MAPFLLVTKSSPPSGGSEKKAQEKDIYPSNSEISTDDVDDERFNFVRGDFNRTYSQVQRRHRPTVQSKILMYALENSNDLKTGSKVGAISK